MYMASCSIVRVGLLHALYFLPVVYCPLANKSAVQEITREMVDETYCETSGTETLLRKSVLSSPAVFHIHLLQLDSATYPSIDYSPVFKLVGTQAVPAIHDDLYVRFEKIFTG